MSFISSPDGIPSKYFCNLHKFRLTKNCLREKGCLKRNEETPCKHLVPWLKVRHQYRRHSLAWST